jgi:hypothetical protein
MTKGELWTLADRLLEGTPEVVEQCVAFIETESFGLWHGRARAKMSRRMKHINLTAGQRRRLVTVILNRLANGQFSEQFKDQLRLAVRLDRRTAFEAARKCQGSGGYIQRYAEWVLARQ